MRLCGGGCLRVIADDARCCDECKTDRTPVDDGIKSHSVTDRERYYFLYHSRRWWAKVQPQVMRAHPFCCRCQQAVSVIADHIVPAGIAIQQAQESKRWPFDRYAGFWLMSNLQGLCRECHGIKTGEDKRRVEPWPDVVAAHDAAPKKRWHFA